MCIEEGTKTKIVAAAFRPKIRVSRLIPTILPLECSPRAPSAIRYISRPNAGFFGQETLRKASGPHEVQQARESHALQWHDVTRLDNSHPAQCARRADVHSGEHVDDKPPFLVREKRHEGDEGEVGEEEGADAVVAEGDEGEGVGGEEFGQEGGEVVRGGGGL